MVLAAVYECKCGFLYRTPLPATEGERWCPVENKRGVPPLHVQVRPDLRPMMTMCRVVQMDFDENPPTSSMVFGMTMGASGRIIARNERIGIVAFQNI